MATCLHPKNRVHLAGAAHPSAPNQHRACNSCRSAQLTSFWCLHYNIQIYCLVRRFRSSHLEKFYKKACLKYLAKLTGKHLYQGFFSGRRPSMYQIETPVQVLSCEFCGIFKKIYFMNNWKLLLLKSKIFFLGTVH